MTEFAQRLEHRQVAAYLGALAVGALIGLAAPGTDSVFEALIYPVLGALLYATFLQVPFTALRAAFGDCRFLLAALGVNFIVVPPIAYALSRLAPGGTAVELGVLMVLLTPCIDYVIVFTRLAGGGDRRLLAAAPLLMLAQLALLPAYLWLFMGPELADIVEPEPFLEAFLLLIALPLALAWATEAWAERSPRGARVKGAVDLLPVALMALTLLVVVASQIPRVRDDIGDVVGVIPIYVAFLVIMAIVGRSIARAVGFDASAARALLFTGATRNSLVVLPLALALGDEYAVTGAVIVAQTLVEVLGMVAYVRLVPRLLPDEPTLAPG
ncbi:bile acid:sodium symporter [Svornostia abyssi]|uniref:Bile acid:sodium symporter n=1 Tax=Svornostia abyssi TaxID=2898438 RepID=A0ABY5PEI1_9ACTN|nr:bile acid:sodium symporter [Parviterribacteraceae bacterium J379]